MKIEFTFIIPDDPYTLTVDETKTVNAVYNGKRWLLGRWEESTQIMHNVIAEADTEAGLDTGGRVEEEGYRYIPFDAVEFPWEASYLTHNYTHEEIEDPIYVHGLAADGYDMGQWTYHYSPDNALTQCRVGFNLRYDPSSKTFTHPPYRSHLVDVEEFWAANVIHAKNIRESVKQEHVYTSADKAKLIEHAVWLEKLESRYRAKGIPHWQIPFPRDIPPLV
jgi:hypothetical protein